jgi:Na+-transporting methylmalonyl-CoA/oxaloacetate decarboxylase gamma subunit
VNDETYRGSIQGGATVVFFLIVFFIIIVGYIMSAIRTGRSVFRVVNPKTNQEKKEQAKEHLEDIREGEAIYGLKRYLLFMAGVMGVLCLIALLVIIFDSDVYF